MKNFSIKIFIDIDIMKLERIVLNINKNLVIIEFCNSIQMSIFIIIKKFRINVIIINKARFVISIHFFLVVLIKLVEFLSNRDLIFEFE